MSITLNDVFNDEYDFEIPMFPCLSIQYGGMCGDSYSIGRQEEELVDELNKIIDDPEPYGLEIDDELIVYYEHDDCNRDELFKWIIGKGKEGIKQENEEVKNEESDEESDEEENRLCDFCDNAKMTEVRGMPPIQEIEYNVCSTCYNRLVRIDDENKKYFADAIDKRGSRAGNKILKHLSEIGCLVGYESDSDNDSDSGEEV